MTLASISAGPSSVNGTKRGEEKWITSLVVIFLFGFLVASVYGLAIYPRQSLVDPVIDLNGFGGIGRNMASGKGFAISDTPTIRRAPLYPAIVCAILSIFGNDGPDRVVYRPVILANAMFAGLTCVCVTVLGAKLFGKRIGVCSGVLTAVLPQTYRYVGMTEVETLSSLLIALTALTGLQLSKRQNIQSIWSGAIFGMVCGAATLVKPVPSLYPFLFTFLLYLREWRSSGGVPGFNRVRALAVALAVFTVCLVPWTLRNAIITHGEFLGISSNSPGEFLRGYVNALPRFAFLKQDFGGSDRSHPDWDQQANDYEDVILRAHGLSMYSVSFDGRLTLTYLHPTLAYELAKERIERDEVKHRLLNQPLPIIRKFIIQSGTFWYIVETRKKSVVIGVFALFLIVGSIVGVAAAHRRQIETFPVVSVVLYYQVIYAATLAMARYSMPLYPILVPLFAYGITVSIRRLSREFRGRHSNA